MTSLKDYGFKWRKTAKGKKIIHTLVFNDCNNNPDDDEIIATIEITGKTIISKYEGEIVDTITLSDEDETKDYAKMMKAQLGRDTLIMQEH